MCVGEGGGEGYAVDLLRTEWNCGTSKSDRVEDGCHVFHLCFFFYLYSSCFSSSSSPVFLLLLFLSFGRHIREKIGMM